MKDGMPMIYHSLFTIHYSPFTIDYSLLTINHPLFTIHQTKALGFPGRPRQYRSPSRISKVLRDGKGSPGLNPVR
ncbi:MAG: hypothetical protein E3J45_00165 [Candidatus Zixiibacteriota bacterium]|nr:MAG: hypothetical protein E3J45_00165 [candidate division Zixibacteria bacterium]